MKIRVYVTLKNGVLDPQGKAIHHALEGLGFAGVNDVRAGKLIELDVADGTQRRRGRGDVPQAARQHGDRELPDRAGGGRRVRSAVIVFPGSNCDRDMAEALRLVTRPRPGDGLAPRERAAGRARSGRHARRLLLWRLSALRRDGGAIAGDARGRRRRRRAASLVLGVCNGFQVLTEARLLPGALMRNAGIRFVCRDVAAQGREQPVGLHRALRGGRGDRRAGRPS